MEDVKPSMTIDRYKVLSKLGAGGMGTVYKAHDTNLDRVVALKLLAPELAADGQSDQRFLREAKTAAKLRHPNIVTVYDFAQTDKKCYLVMDYIQGQSLEQLLKKKKVGGTWACKTMLQILSAMEHAHEQDIIHRDIKPANILLDARGVAYVSDFGLAKILSGESAKISRTGMILGTPSYMAPEQAAGDPNNPVDTRSDIYSLGAVFYEMLTGKPPLEGDTLFNILFKLANEEVVSPRKINPKVPPALDKICLKALEKKKENRYQTAREMADDIKKHLQTPGDLELTASPTVKTARPDAPPRQTAIAMPPPKPKNLRKKPAWPATAIAGLLLLVLVVLSIIAYELSGRNERKRSRSEARVESHDASQPENPDEDDPAPDEDDPAPDEDDPAPHEDDPETEGDDTGENHRKTDVQETCERFFSCLVRKKHEDAVELCSRQFQEQDIPVDTELRDAFLSIDGKHLSAASITLRSQTESTAEFGISMADGWKDTVYMVWENGGWKYDGTELDRLIRREALQECGDMEKWQDCLRCCEKIATNFQENNQVKPEDVCCATTLDTPWHLQVVMMRARMIFKYSSLLRREFWGTSQEDVVVFIVKTDEPREFKVVLASETSGWKLREIR